jgi:transcriptional regulator with XRE-family HTH domain
MPKTSKTLFRPTYIRQWREYRGLSLVQLAERVAEFTGKSMTHPTLSRIENGRIGYTQRILEAIAHSLLCEPADLIMRNPLDKSAPWSIMDQMKKADPETRARIAAVVEALSKTGT